MIFHIFESDFNKKFSSAYKLSILVGMDSLVYFVHDPKARKALTLRSFRYQHGDSSKNGFERELLLIKGMDNIISLPFQEVRIVLPHTPFVLVPARLFSEEQAEKSLSELTSLNSGSPVLTQEIGAYSAHVVYQGRTDYHEVLQRYFPSCRFIHPVTALLAAYSDLTAKDSGHHAFLYYRDSRLTIVVTEGKELLLCNTFSCQSSEDVLYHTKLVLSQLRLDSISTKVSLSGMVVENSDLHNLLKRFFSKFQFIDDLPYLEFATKFHQVPKHLYFDISATSLLD